MADTLRHLEEWARRAPLIIGLLALGHGPAVLAQGPDWTWAHAVDDGNIEFVRDIAVDQASGAIYVVGVYQSATVVGAPFGLPASVNGTPDAFLAKLNASGAVLWSKGLGSNWDDGAFGVDVSPSGMVAVTGHLSGWTANLGISSVGGHDAFVALYDPNGVFQWVRTMGGTQDDEGTGVCFAGGMVVAYGTFTHATGLTGIPSATGLYYGQAYAFLNAYSLGGTLGWSKTAISPGDILSERIATNGTVVYVTGETTGSAFSWMNQGGTFSTTVNTTNPNALYISAVSAGGSVLWSELIDNPGDAASECNGVAVSCEAVYITGHTHDGSTFPGGVQRTVGGVHDYFFLAALDPASGNTAWVRTASSNEPHGAIGYDITIGRNKQPYVGGALEGTVTTDQGTVITGDDDPDVMVARFSSNGTPVWMEREVEDQDEMVMAMATTVQGDFVAGGKYETSLVLGSMVHPGGSSENLFVAGFTDPGWSNAANNPARFAQPGPFCEGVPAVDLNAYLVAYADSALIATGITAAEQAVGAPDGAGALFASPGAALTLDLGDTLSAGEVLTLTWRSQTNLVQARMYVQTSMDGVTWSAASQYQTSSGSWSSLFHTVGADVRYLRLQRHTSATYGAFLVDAVRYLGSTAAGGLWSGGPYVTATGIFSPTGPGSFPITYTVVQGSCTYSTSRVVTVIPAPVGGTVSGGGAFCPTDAGMLMLTGHSGPVLRWERSDDGGVTWTVIANTSTSQPWSGLNGSVQFRAVVDGGDCGIALSSIDTVSVLDTVPPTATCPPSVTVIDLPVTECLVPYTVPVITYTDNCNAAELSSTQITVLPGGAMVLSTSPLVFATSAFMADAGMLLLLGPGTHQFADTVTDGAGNTSVCTWSVQVVDNIAPTIICPDTLVVAADASCLGPVSLPAPQILLDTCSTVTWTMDATDGMWPVGDSVVHYTALDLGGNMSTCTLAVHVVDAAPVTFYCPLSDPVILPAGAGCAAVMPNLVDSITFSDCSAFTVVQDPPPGTTVSGSFTATMTITDAAGNISTNSDQVVVVDTAGPQITCPDTLLIPADAGCLGQVTLPAPLAVLDDCGSVTWTSNATDGAWPVGDSTVIYTATDADGNTGSCAFMVRVVDDTPPTLGPCPSNISVMALPGRCGAAVTWDEPVYSDICTAVLWHSGPASGSQITIGSTTITYTVASGPDSLSCSFTIDVQPAPAPVLSYGTAAVCATAAAIAPTVTAPVGGLFSSASLGMAIDPSTGVIDIQAAPLGSHSITYTMAGPCPQSTTVGLLIEAASEAGTDAALTVCENAGPTDLFALLGPGAATGGTWTGPLGAMSGTYDPAVHDSGIYTYIVPGNAPCLNDSASVIVTEDNMVTWYADADGDSYGDPGTGVPACVAPTGYVPNDGDLCPSDPLKHDPGQCGCGVADDDGDGDGVADCNDICPGHNDLIDDDTDGVPDGCDSCPTVIGQVGSPCDDGQANTANDQLDATCNCVGQTIDCLGVAGGTALPGTACDDGNANTGNDTWDNS
ncbi:MAG: HYR domain-containing protein [Flavobacteriales bacterium]|nr:HYR domain-containing protein [Flavobacteriales bacterium]